MPFVELVIGPADFINAGAKLRGIRNRVETALLPAATEVGDTAHLVEVAESRLPEPQREVVPR